MIPVVAYFGLECEPVVRPVETLAEAYVHAEHLKILVGVVGVLYGVVVVVVVTVAIVVVHATVI